MKKIDTVDFFADKNRPEIVLNVKQLYIQRFIVDRKKISIDRDLWIKRKENKDKKQKREFEIFLHANISFFFCNRMWRSYTLYNKICKFTAPWVAARCSWTWAPGIKVSRRTAIGFVIFGSCFCILCTRTCCYEDSRWLWDRRNYRCGYDRDRILRRDALVRIGQHRGIFDNRAPSHRNVVHRPCKFGKIENFSYVMFAEYRKKLTREKWLKKKWTRKNMNFLKN